MPFIPDSATDRTPAAAVLGRRLYIAYKEESSDRIRLASTDRPTDDTSWTFQNPPFELPGSGPNQIRTSHGPALASLNNCLWLAFKGHNNTYIWLASWLPPSGAWQGQGYARDAQTSRRVAMQMQESSRGDELAICHRGVEDDDAVWIYRARTGDETVWHTQTEHAPAMTVFFRAGEGQRAQVAYTRPDNRIMFTQHRYDRRSRRTYWTPPEQIPDAWSREGPALTTHRSLAKWGTHSHTLVYVAFRSSTDNQIWIGSYDGEVWMLHGTVPNQYTNMAPALVSFGGSLYVVCRGHNNPLVWYREVPVDTYQHITFHAIPHYFKMGNLDEAEGDQCRRQGTRKVGDGPCECPPPDTVPPQQVYPQCIPAAWARLFGAYRLVLPPEQRRWEIGTPSNPDPLPDAGGDYVSTYSMGVVDRGNPSRLEDWPDRPPVQIETLSFDLDATDEVAIQERADAIESALKSLVPNQPVYIEHNDHAWNIFGGNAFGYYSHGQNPESEGLTDWCSWENAPWRKAGLYIDEREHPHYAIKYLKSGELKPDYRRMGSLSFWVWAPGWASHNIQFVDLPSERSIDWTPNQYASRAGVGYVWIEEPESLPDLDLYGVPLVRPPDQWDPDLGWLIPVPENSPGQCSCGGPDGCSSCRTRLHLPFWVHNTTLDRREYSVDLYIWTPNGQWAPGQADRIETVRLEDGRDVYPCFHPSYPQWYGDRLPCPLPGQRFEIPARRDLSADPAGRQPDNYDWQPFGWYIDFTNRELSYGQIHGIRLELLCIDNKVVQDIKQLWFRTQLR